MDELIEFFGQPSVINAESFLWTNKKPFYTVCFQKGKIYISVDIKKKDLVYPLHYNTSYSELKRLLVVNGDSLYNVFVSLCLVTGIAVRFEDTVEEIYAKIINKYSI